jgi:hypothetical protein
MKKQILLIATIAILSTPSFGQYKLNAGGGFYGTTSAPGFVLEFEYEKFYKDDFSAPLRADLAFTSDDEFNALTFDIHKGFRKYFSNGLILEQAVGAGIITSFYNSDYIWSYDKYTNVVFHYNKPAIGFTPSVTLGVAYDLTKNAEKSNLIWVRPKVYWNLGARGLNMPFFALQVGYTYNFKTT